MNSPGAYIRRGLRLLPARRPLHEGDRAGTTFVCPICRGALDKEAGGFRCGKCDRSYPEHGGIPDFRVFADPFLTFEEDRRRTNLMLAVIDRFKFPELLEHYWSFSDITPPLLRRKFIRSALLGEARAERVLSSLENGSFNEPVVAKRVLDLGSGTGNFIAAAASRYPEVVGIDIAMRHLHVSRRRFMDRGVPAPPLACCCAEQLPFPDDYFDLIVTTSTLEFTRDQDRVLAECARTLRPGGALYIQTVNRYAFGRDPYAYLWGVGFLPRRWQAPYVRWRRQASYENIRTFSLGEFKRLTNRYFGRGEFVLPDVQPDLLTQFSRATQLQIAIYKKLRQSRFFQGVLTRVGPGWEVLLRKRSS